MSEWCTGVCPQESMNRDETTERKGSPQSRNSYVRSTLKVEVAPAVPAEAPRQERWTLPLNNAISAVSASTVAPHQKPI